MDKVSKSWSEFFKQIQNEEFCIKLNKFLNNEYQDYTCYPPREFLFSTFRFASWKLSPTCHRYIRNMQKEYL